jgi:hypothetical protein
MSAITRRVLLPLLLVSFVLLTTGCYELFIIQTDGKIKIRETAFRTLFLSDQKLFHGISFLGKDRDLSNGLVTYGHDFHMGFDFQWSAGVLSKKSTAYDFSYITIGVGISGGSEFHSVILQPYSDGSGWQISAADQGGVVAGTTEQILTSGFDTNLLDVRINTTMNPSTNDWNLHVYVNPLGEPQGDPLHTWSGIPNLGWTYQPTFGAVGMEKKSEAFVGLPAIHAVGDLPSSATDYERINYDFASAYGRALSAQRITDLSVTPSWRSEATGYLTDFEKYADEARIGISVRYSFKKSPAAKAVKLLDKAIKASEKARKKIDKGAQPKQAWKAIKKARDRLLKSQNIVRELD